MGTSTGVLTLWDRRFGLLLKSWHVGVASTGRSIRIHQCVVHPSKGKGKYVMVAVEASKWGSDKSSTNLVEVWDIERSVLVETFVTCTSSSTSEPLSDPHELTGVDADTTSSAAIAALVRNGGDDRRNSAQLSTSPAPDVRAMVVGFEFGGTHRSEMYDIAADPHSTRSAGRGFVISGSEDRKIRLWDLGRPERSTVLSGLESEHDRPSYRWVPCRVSYNFFADGSQCYEQWNCIYLYRDVAAICRIEWAGKSCTPADGFDHS